MVKNGEIIGEGFHQKFGGPHAEVHALRAAGTRAKGATLYVNLEPCSHWGKTPPCVLALVNAGIRTAVVAVKDPNPIVSGRGIAALRKAGIKVIMGVEQMAARELNRSFITYMTKKRPYVLLKMAMTLDGKIATAKGDSKWISNEHSRKLGYMLRAGSDAVLVGVRTARIDKPRLTSHGQGRDPMKIVLKRGVKLKPYLATLAKNGISRLMVEGGGETAWKFVKERFVDEIYFFIAPKILGGRKSISPVEGEGFQHISKALPLHNVNVVRIKDDILIHAFTRKAA